MNWLPLQKLLNRSQDSKLARQSALLIIMQGMGMVLSFVFTIVLTKQLTVGDYGVFRYWMTYLTLAMTLLQFGWPYSAARLLALEEDREVQLKITGACILLLVVSMVLGVMGTAVLVYAGPFLNYRLPSALLYIAPFVYATLGQYAINSVCQGLNRIGVLSLQQTLPYLILLPLTLLESHLLQRFSLNLAFFGYAFVFAIVIAIGFYRIGFSCRGSWHYVGRILRENRNTGLPIYIGGIFGVASGHFVAMWVADFSSSETYGQYALAVGVSAPLGALVSSIGTVIFRTSSTRQSLNPPILLYSLGLGLLLWVVYYGATELLLVFAFGEKYRGSVRMAQILGVGAILVGWGDIFQRFLGAKGCGRALCAAAIVTGCVALITAGSLIRSFSVYAAVISSVLAGAAYLLTTGGVYLRYVWSDRRSAERLRREVTPSPSPI